MYTVYILILKNNKNYSIKKNNNNNIYSKKLVIILPNIWKTQVCITTEFSLNGIKIKMTEKTVLKYT